MSDKTNLDMQFPFKEGWGGVGLQSKVEEILFFLLYTTDQF